jgi:hypothetical protein
MEKGHNGRVAIEEIYEELKTAACSKILEKKLDQVAVFKQYGVSKADLHGLITGKAKMPLARLIMFATDLGLTVTMTVK